MSDGVTLRTGSLLGDHFILEAEIGRGLTGAVFRARDLRKNEAHDADSRVAIKVLHEDFKRHPNAVRALVREARKAQGIAHQNIVKVHDVVRDDSNAYIVAELLEGESLDRLMQRTAGVGIGFDQALKIIREVCQAMSHAHGRSVLHTGFKPENVFLTRQGAVKVLDFGIARALSRGDWASNVLTLFDASALDTLAPAYAGYEVTEGEEPHVKDDIYAIACVFYELMTGRHPYRGMSAEQASKAGLQPARPIALPRAQWRVLRNALEFRRDRRPASALQFAQALVPKRSSPAKDFGWSLAATVVIGGALLAVYMTYRTPVVSAAPGSEITRQVESASSQSPSARTATSRISQQSNLAPASITPGL